MNRSSKSIISVGKMLIILPFLLFILTGCEKISNKAKNLQSDLIGLDRNVYLYACMTGKLVKSYHGTVRINNEDKSGTSLLIDGKKLHTNLCYVISEVGLKENSISQ